MEDLQSDYEEDIRTLHKACRDGNLDTVAFFMDIREVYAYCTNDDGRNAMHIAALYGKFEIVKYLAERDCNQTVLCQDTKQYTALHMAAEKGHIEIVKYLIETQRGCDLASRTIFGDTVLHRAVISGNLELFKYLIGIKCNPEWQGEYEKRALHVACERGHLEIIKYALEELHCDCSCMDDAGYTPLHYAALRDGNLDIIEYMLTKCNSYIPGYKGRTLLHSVCEAGKVAIMKYLMEEKSLDVYYKDYEGNTAIHVAAENGKLDIMKYLAERNVNLEYRGYLGRTPLHNACMNGHLNIVKFLIEEKTCDPHCKDDDGCLLIHVAAECGMLDVVKYLVEERVCDLFSMNNQKNTAIHLAAKSGSIELLKYLIAKKCNPMSLGLMDKAPIHFAYVLGHIKVVKYLVEEVECDVCYNGESRDSVIELAVHGGNVDLIKYLTNILFEYPNELKRESIQAACDAGHLEIMQYLVEKELCKLSFKDEDGRTMLHYAASAGKMRILKYLILNGCDKQHKDKWGQTPLHKACIKGHLNIVKYLLDEQECNPALQDNNGDSVIHMVATNGNLDLLKYCVAKKIDVKCTNKKGRTALYSAAENGHYHILKYLVEEVGCNIAGRDDAGNTVLNIAAINNNLHILKYCIQMKCDVRCKGQWGRTPLHNACESGSFEAVKYLIDEIGCDTTCNDEKGNSIIHMAVLHENIKILMYLVHTNCKLDVGNKRGETPLHFACNKGYIETVKYMIEECKCDPLIKTKYGYSAIHMAVFAKNVDLLKYLVVMHCDIQSKGEFGRTPLHYASSTGHLQSVKYLVEEAHCDPLMLDDFGNSALHMSTISLSNGVDNLKYFVSSNCDVHCKNHQSMTLLHQACANGNINVIRYLVEEHSFDLECRNSDGCYPIHVAAQAGIMEIVKYLISRKCNLNSRGYIGRTVLHHACSTDNVEMVKFLVEEHRLDTSAIDDYGMTAYDLAFTWHRSELIKYFDELSVYPISAVTPGLPPDSTILQDANKCWVPQNKQGEPVKWNSPQVRDDLGPMPPEWCAMQKRTGDFSFVNTKTNLVCATDPRAESFKRYQLALRSGYLCVNVIKVLIIGAAGVGKTHLLHLLLGEPLPSVRQSTPLMARPVHTFLSTKKDTDTFQKVTPKELNELLANTVNASIPEQIPEEHTITLVAAHPKKTELHHTSYQQKESPVYDTNHKYSSDVNGASFQLPSELEKELIPIIAQSEQAPLMTIDWIYFTDSGGQPQFHQILPAFIPNTNLSVFVLKLCDNLNTHPTAEFYDKGRRTKQIHHSALTNKDILMHCTQAMRIGSSESRLMVVGTFRDKEQECTDQTREQKEKELTEVLAKQYMVYSGTSRTVLFPLNTNNPDELDMKVIGEIRREIVKRHKSERIPLKWLVFHQELLRTSKDVLSLKQCIQIASHLHMVDDDAKDSLKFFANLNVIMYYPTILEEIVFINPQILLNILTELVKSVAYDAKNEVVATDTLVLKAQENGTISEELLRILNNDAITAFNELFQPVHLFLILKHLKIISECNDQSQKCGMNNAGIKEYFMPSLLKKMSFECIATKIKEYKDTVTPVILQHKNATCLKLGEFCSLITSLLMSKDWEIANSNEKPLCLHSNIVILSFGSSLVTLVDRVAYIEIHVDSQSLELSREACASIKRVFDPEIKTEMEVTFLCPCQPDDNPRRHRAKLCKDQLLQCTIYPTKRFSLHDSSKHWLENERESHTFPDITSHSELYYDKTHISRFNMENSRISCPVEIHDETREFAKEINQDTYNDVTMDLRKYTGEHVPTVKLLTCLSHGQKKNSLNVIQKSCCRYGCLAMFLLDDENMDIVLALEKECLKDSEQITIAIYRKWIKGTGIKPVTWRTLASVLKKIPELNSLATELEQFISF